MDIRIILDDGSQWNINTNNDSNVKYVKESLSKITSLPLNNFKLFFNGYELKDEDTIKSAGIIKNSLIQCSLNDENQKNDLPDHQFFIVNDKAHTDPPSFAKQVEFICNMGFKNEQVKYVLRNNKFDVKKAVNTLIHEKFVYPRVEITEEEEGENEGNEEEEDSAPNGPKWQKFENALLIKKFQKYGTDWETLRKYFPYRTAEDIESHWDTYLRKRVVSENLLNLNANETHHKHKKWAEKEEDILFALWKVLGNDWSEISRHFENRSPDSIFKHWTTKLRPKLINKGILEQNTSVNGDDIYSDDDLIVKDPNQLISSEYRHRRFDSTTLSETEETLSDSAEPGTAGVEWTQEMDDKLIKAYKKHGKKWGIIVSLFPGLKIIDIQRRWSKIGNEVDDNDEEEFLPETGRKHSSDDGQKITWSNEENELFISKLFELGQDWYKMAPFFPDKKLKNLSCHYRLHIKKKLSNEDIKKIESLYVPDIKKKVEASSNKQWTQDEDELLHEKVKEYGQRFDIITQFFEGRSKNALSSHYYQLTKKDTPKVSHKEDYSSEDDDYKFKNGFSKNRWTSKEDSLLIKKHKEESGHWDRIIEFFPSRTKNAIINHWQTVLKPRLLKEAQERGSDDLDREGVLIDGRKSLPRPSKWSQDEDSLIINLWRILGPNWKEIQKKIPNRTNNSISSHWYTIWRPKLQPAEIREIDAKYKSGQMPATYEDIPEEQKKIIELELEKEIDNKWTAEEEELLKEKYAEMGKKWLEISKFFPTKTINNIINHWRAIKQTNETPSITTTDTEGVKSEIEETTTDEPEERKVVPKQNDTKMIHVIPIIKKQEKSERIEPKVVSIDRVQNAPKFYAAVPQAANYNQSYSYIQQKPEPVKVISGNPQEVSYELTPMEESVFRNAISIYGTNWKKIAEHLPGRSAEYIMRYWMSVFSKKYPNTNIVNTQQQPQIQTQYNYIWSREKDILMLQKFQEFKGDMNKIILFFPGYNQKFLEDRIKFLQELNKKTVQQRTTYMSQQRMNLCKSEWTPEEDAILCAQYAQQGGDFEKIAPFLPNKAKEIIPARWFILSNNIAVKSTQRKHVKSDKPLPKPVILPKNVSPNPLPQRMPMNGNQNVNFAGQRVGNPPNIQFIQQIQPKVINSSTTRQYLPVSQKATIPFLVQKSNPSAPIANTIKKTEVIATRLDSPPKDT